MLHPGHTVSKGRGPDAENTLSCHGSRRTNHSIITILLTIRIQQQNRKKHRADAPT
jgi:hypothetical protein